MMRYLTPLSHEEVLALMERINAGDSEAQEELIQRNLGLVHTIARRYFARDNAVEFDDLVQEGVLGLMQAIDKYDPTRGTQFSTVAFQWIRQAVSRYAVSAGTIKRAKDPNRRCVTPSAVRANLIRRADMVQLDKPLSPESGRTLMDVLRDNTSSVEDEACDRLEAERLLGGLSPKHQAVIWDWMHSEKTQKEICAQHGLCRSMIYVILEGIRARECEVME